MLHVRSVEEHCVTAVAFKCTAPAQGSLQAHADAWCGSALQCSEHACCELPSGPDILGKHLLSTGWQFVGECMGAASALGWAGLHTQCLKGLLGMHAYISVCMHALFHVPVAATL